MSFRYALETRATPEQVFRAFTDFSDRRAQVNTAGYMSGKRDDAGHPNRNQSQGSEEIQDPPQTAGFGAIATTGSRKVNRT